MSLDKLQSLLRYYRTSFIFLWVTALFATILFIMRMSGNFGFTSLGKAAVHLGTVGALTFGLMGLYFRVFFAFDELKIKNWVVDTLHILLSLGTVLLFVGFIMESWFFLVLGFLGVAYALIWWTIQYYRWFFTVKASERKGVLLFGALASLGLVAAVLIGGYLIHGSLVNNTPQNFRLAHIHAGLVGWASLALLGVGVAIRGGHHVYTKSAGFLQNSAWIWLAGVALMVGMMMFWQVAVIIVAGVLILLGFIGYGYSMPKINKQEDVDSENEGSDKNSTGKKLLPYIIVGFIALFLTILVGFDISINYPSGRAGIHRIFGIAGWLLMTYMMSMLSEIPRVNLSIQDLSQDTELAEDVEQYLYPAFFKFSWVLLTIGILAASAGYFISPHILFIGGLVVSIATLILTSFVLVKYRTPEI